MKLKVSDMNEDGLVEIRDNTIIVTKLGVIFNLLLIILMFMTLENL